MRRVRVDMDWAGADAKGFGTAAVYGLAKWDDSQERFVSNVTPACISNLSVTH